MPDLKVIDPTKLEGVYVVLSDDRRGFMGWLIKAHEHGNYNHAMMMIEPGQLLSQADVFKRIPVTLYMKTGQFLKFWRVNGLTESDVVIIHDIIKKRLALPWWKRSYDYLGLIGQALPFLHWLQIPALWFCSEAVVSVLRKTSPLLWLPKQPSPSDLDTLFRQHPEQFDVAGYWVLD